MAIDIQQLINSPFTVRFVSAMARLVPPAVGYPACNLIGKWAATRRSSDVTQAVRVNQWVARGCTLDQEMLDRVVCETLQSNARDIYDLYHSLERPEDIRRRICLNSLAEELARRPEFDSRGLVVAGIHLSSFDSVLLSMVRQGVIVTYLRMSVSGEFKISYGRLGPTESRVVAVLLNTAMYFWGIQNVAVNRLTFSVYDIPVLALALLLFTFFFNTALQETRLLAALGE